MKTLLVAFILTLTLTNFAFAGENIADCNNGTANNTFDIAQTSTQPAQGQTTK